MAIDAATTESAPMALVKSSMARGYQRTTWVILILVALIPAAILTANKAPGYESAPLIVAAFWIVPTLLLMAWTAFDRDGQAAREIFMWFEAVSKDARRVGPSSSALAAYEATSTNWHGRSLADTALQLRASIAPLVHSRLPAGFWIAESRWFFPLCWTFLAIVVVGIFMVTASLSAAR
jgi:hypothetical protein